MKWFTYCCIEPSAPKRDPDWHDRQRLALLFSSDDDTELTEDDVKKIRESTLVAELFPQGHYVIPRGSTQVLLTTDWRFLGSTYPDKATSSTPLIQLTVRGKGYTVSLHRRYNDCRSLLKASVGCAHCDDKGFRCLSRALPEKVYDDGNLPDLYEDDIKEKCKHGVTKIGDFTYASPVMTKDMDDAFAHAARPSWGHYFENIGEWAVRRSAAAKLSADTKKFRKQQCSKCVLNHVCHRERTCPGAYPPEDEITRQILERWQPQIERSGWEPWQFWAVAKGAGRVENWRKRSTNANVRAALGGLDMDFNAFVTRIKTNVETLYTGKDYTLLSEIFELPKTKEEAEAYPSLWCRPPRDRSVALWLMSLERRWWDIGPNRYGQIFRKSVAWRELMDTGVRVAWAGPTYLYRDTYYTSYAEYYEHEQRELPVSKIPVDRAAGRYYTYA